MSQTRISPLFLLLMLLLIACGSAGEEETSPAVPPPDVFDILPTDIPAVEFPPTDIPPLQTAEAGPIRPGCGDYRLLVTIKTDAVGAGARVSGPEGEVDVVWNLYGPGLALSDPPAAPRVFNEDNREAFGIEGNEENAPVTASFILLLSGVRQGQRLTLEMGQDAPGANGTAVTIANANNGVNDNASVLGRFQVSKTVQTATVDLCAAKPMRQLTPPANSLSPRVLAFFYPWWGTTAVPDSPYRCSGDSFGWIREANGRRVFVTAHTPIAREGDQIIYRQTACWMEETDGDGRNGQIYDVYEIHFLAEQMKLAQTYGIDAFAASVHGDSPVEMDYLRQKLLPVAARMNFEIAPLYEAPETGWDYDDAADVAKVGGHLRQLVEMFAGQSATVTIPDETGAEQIVIFVDPAVLARFTTAETWVAIREQINEAGIPYFLFSGPSAFAHVFSTGFDGVYNDLEVIETYEAPLGLEPYALRDERRLAYRAAAWMAQERGMPYALPVVLGWEGSPALLGPEDVPLTRDYGAPGAYGTYYRVRWEDALEHYPDWIVITSWNEWAEGTEIEPSQEYPPARFNFLLATKAYACIWRGDC